MKQDSSHPADLVQGSPTPAKAAQVDTGGLRNQIARRWKWPMRALAGLALLATLHAFLCPPHLEVTGRAWVLLIHAAVMLRTFGLQVGVGMLLLLGLLVLLRRPGCALLVALTALFWLVPEGWKQVRPVTGSQAASGSAAAPELTVLSINALYGRASVEAIEREALACNADVIVFQEYQDTLATLLKPELRQWPHRVEMPRPDAFGQAVFSRTPLEGTPTIFPPSRWSASPQITATIRFDGLPVRITNVHLLPPVGISIISEQRAEVAGLSRDVADQLSKDPRAGLILAGDFNATTDAALLRPLFSAGLADSFAQSTRGRGGTWPADGLFSHLGKVRIDNLFHAPSLTAIASGVGGSINSDHLPTWSRYRRADR